jgi:hypothetical protein
MAIAVEVKCGKSIFLSKEEFFRLVKLMEYSSYHKQTYEKLLELKEFIEKNNSDE